MQGGAFAGATSFLKTGLPHPVEFKCTSNKCPWLWAAGAWNHATGEIAVTFDNGTRTMAMVRDNCSELAWAGGGSWRNEMQLVKKVIRALA
jgi:hypothetical protein